MKTIHHALLTLLLAGASSAATIWETDFNSPETLEVPSKKPVEMNNARADIWQCAESIVIFVDDNNQLVVKTNNDGKTRGVTRALTTNLVALADSTGDDSFYRFSFDIINIWENGEFNVEFLKGTRDADGSSSEANTYKIDLLSPFNAELIHETKGGGTLTSLSDTTYTRTDTGTTAVIEFEFDGAGDLVLVMDTRSLGGGSKSTVIDNLKLDIVGSTSSPPSFTNSLLHASDATEEAAYSDSVAGSATNENGGVLTYSKADGPEWLTVAGNGVLSGTPAQSDVGTNSFVVRVDNEQGSFSTATLLINVLNVPDLPVFAMDTIYKPAAFVNSAYSNSIAQCAYDLDGDALSYSKVGLSPAWLTVDADGALHGTPGPADLGEHTVSIRVDAPDGYDTADLSIHVVSAPAFRGKPNILYILADDLGYLDISAHEYYEDTAKPDLEFETPNIDTLFNDGIKFQTALMGNSVCAPSRAAILSGRIGSRFGFEANIPHGPASEPGSLIGLNTNQATIADVLKDGAGYKTYCIGKWHLGDNTNYFHPNVRGFDEFYGIIGGSRSYCYEDPADLDVDKVIMSNHTAIAEPTDMYITDFLTDQALTYISDQTAHNPEQPWFMYMSYTAPHGPMHAKEEDMQRIPLVSHFGSEYTKDANVQILETNGTVRSFTSRDNDYLRQVYGAMVVSMDDNVGRLLNRLGELGIAENTLVVFHSDNGGPMVGSNWSLNRPLKGAKGQLWEGGLRVPFAMYWPGIIPGGQTVGFGTPISSVDMLPTFAAISGADQTQEIRTDGINLMPLLRGRISTLPPRKLFWRRGSALQIAVRCGDWKYYRNRNTDDNYLYDLGDTYSEYNNQESSNPSKLAEMQAELAELEASVPDPHWNGDGEMFAITTYALNDAVAGQPYAMPLSHSPAGESVTWSIIAGKPDWLSIHPSSGLLSGTPLSTHDAQNLITLQIANATTNSTYRVPLTVIGGYDPADTDSDGLPDAWEISQFTNLTVSAGGPGEDQDGDGRPDWKEYAEGTEAANPASRLIIPVTAAENGLFEVSFDGRTNRSYTLRTTTSLNKEPWLYADSVTALQSNGTVTLQAQVPGDPDSFFGRVEIKAD